MAWSPLAGGRLFDPADEAAQRIAKAAEDMSRRYCGASVDQLAYAWILAHPSRPLPIIGSNRIERIQSAAAAAEILLEREDWYALWEAAQGRQSAVGTFRAYYPNSTTRKLQLENALAAIRSTAKNR